MTKKQKRQLLVLVLTTAAMYGVVVLTLWRMLHGGGVGTDVALLILAAVASLAGTGLIYLEVRRK